MKKSGYIIVVVAALAAVAGALAAVAVYLSRREKELEEYEQLLFSEEFNEEFSEEATDELAAMEPETEAPVAPAEEV